MAKKTWVKLKRGLLIDPKHRMELGKRIWLYMYMLDIADWNTGKVIEWRDRDAADDLQMPISTIRTQRRQIEDAGYIGCRQYSDHQTITIRKWVNPREYSGRVYNSDDSDQEYPPFEGEGVNEGDKEGVNEGTQNLTPVHINHISHTTNHNKKGGINLFDACVEIYKNKKGLPVTDGYHFSLMIKEFKSNGVTAEDYSNAIDAQDADPDYTGSKPTSYKKWAIGYAKKRKNAGKRKAPTQEDNKSIIERLVKDASK